MGKRLVIGIAVGAFAGVVNALIDIDDAYAGYVQDLEITPAAICNGAPDCQINDVSILLEDSRQKQLSLTVAMVGQDLQEGDIVAFAYTQSPTGYLFEQIGFDMHKNIERIEILPVR